MITGTKILPACWRKLVQMEFPGDLEGIKNEKQVKGVDDPEPAYDDCRSVVLYLDDDTQVVFELASGQSNYYGGITVYHHDEEVYSDILGSFEGPFEFEDDTGEKYKIEVDFIHPREVT